jgi:hypothetical protein
VLLYAFIALYFYFAFTFCFCLFHIYNCLDISLYNNNDNFFPYAVGRHVIRICVLPKGTSVICIGLPQSLGFTQAGEDGGVSAALCLTAQDETTRAVPVI